MWPEGRPPGSPPDPQTSLTSLGHLMAITSRGCRLEVKTISCCESSPVARDKRKYCLSQVNRLRQPTGLLTASSSFTRNLIQTPGWIFGFCRSKAIASPTCFSSRRRTIPWLYSHRTDTGWLMNRVKQGRQTFMSRAFRRQGARRRYQIREVVLRPGAATAENSFTSHPPERSEEHTSELQSHSFI